MYGSDLIDPITPFHDPYSDVSLFLSKKIRQIAITKEGPKNWSHQLEEELLQKITPDFIKRFPDHRLGPATIRRTWERVYHLVDLLKLEQETLTPCGKLNLHFLIRENLKPLFAQSKNGSFHPFLLAQQLALKIGETIATYEGERPALEHLTEVIWSSLSHLLPPPPQKKRVDVKDRLITKWMFDILRYEETLSYAELSQKLHHKLKFYQTLEEDLTPLMLQLKIEWATVLLPQTSLYQKLQSHEIQSLRTWVSSFTPDNLQELKTEALRTKTKCLLSDLEILFWSELRKKIPTPLHSETFTELVLEAQTHLMNHPSKPWTNVISYASYLMKKSEEIAKLFAQKEWSKRIEYWALQGELALRFIELPESPLLHFASAMQSKNRPFKDTIITTQLREQYLYRYPSPLIEPSLVHKHADFMRKYGWYRLASTPADSTLDRFIQYHDSLGDLHIKIQSQFPTLPLPLGARKNRYRPITKNGTESH